MASGSRIFQAVFTWVGESRVETSVVNGPRKYDLLVKGFLERRIVEMTIRHPFAPIARKSEQRVHVFIEKVGMLTDECFDLWGRVGLHPDDFNTKRSELFYLPMYRVSPHGGIKTHGTMYPFAHWLKQQEVIGYLDLDVLLFPADRIFEYSPGRDLPKQEDGWTLVGNAKRVIAENDPLALCMIEVRVYALYRHADGRMVAYSLGTSPRLRDTWECVNR